MLFIPGDGSVHGVNLMPGLGEPVAFSRDLFVPGGIEVMVMRSLESERPGRVAGR